MLYENVKNAESFLWWVGLEVELV